MTAKELLLTKCKSEDLLFVNKDLAHKFRNWNVATLFAILESEESKFIVKGQLLEGNFFTISNDEIIKTLGVTEPTLLKTCKILEENNLIETKRMGLPAKKYYRIIR